MNSPNRVKLAYDLAEKAHKGQIRRFSGEPYFNHPKRIYEQLIGEPQQIVALLHDVLEDTNITIDNIDDIVKLNSEEKSALVLLTKPKDWSYVCYIVSLLQNPLARFIKLLDLQDNLRDLPRGHQRDKYELAYLLLSEGFSK